MKDVRSVWVLSIALVLALLGFELASRGKPEVPSPHDEAIFKTKCFRCHDEHMATKRSFPKEPLKALRHSVDSLVNVMANYDTVWIDSSSRKSIKRYLLYHHASQP
jgi:hypothetical protein